MQSKGCAESKPRKLDGAAGTFTKTHTYIHRTSFSHEKEIHALDIFERQSTFSCAS